MSDKSIYKITVLKWVEKNPGHKSSYKKTMIANNMIHDSSLNALPVSHRWLWIGILLTCGDLSSDTIEMTGRQLRALLESSKSVVSALDALQGFQLLRYDVTQSDAYIKELKEVKRRNKKKISAKADSPPESALSTPEINFLETEPSPSERLLRIWNENRGSLPQALTISGPRKIKSAQRWREFPNEDFWINVVRRMACSSFCCGDAGWKANFDFFIKPDTHLKVNEGQYDNKKKQGPVGIVGSAR